MLVKISSYKIQNYLQYASLSRVLHVKQKAQFFCQIKLLPEVVVTLNEAAERLNEEQNLHIQNRFNTVTL